MTKMIGHIEKYAPPGADLQEVAVLTGLALGSRLWL